MKHNWEYKKLGEVAESDLGKTLNQSKDTGIFQPYLCSINIQWDAIDLSIVKQARFEESEFDRYSVKSGDLLVCEGGDTGRAAIWNGGPMLYQNALHRIRFNDRIIPRFALLYLRHLKMNGDIDSKYSKGVTIKHLVKSSLNSIPIPLPPLSTQQSIVSELDSLSKIIADCKETLKDYDALEQSIFYDMFGDPVKNEKGWEVREMGDICKVGTGSTPDRKNERFYEGYIPWVKSTEVCNLVINNTQEHISQEAYDSSNCSLYPKGSILMAMYGQGKTRGQVGILGIEACTNQAVAAIILPDNIATTFLFVQLQLMYNYIRGMANGCNQTNLNVGIVKSIVIICPPLPLQQTFASKIEAIEEMKVETKKALQEAETLFQARMDYWFN